MSWIHDGKNGDAGTYGSCYIYKVQIISHKGEMQNFPNFGLWLIDLFILMPIFINCANSGK